MKVNEGDDDDLRQGDRIQVWWPTVGNMPAYAASVLEVNTMEAKLKAQKYPYTYTSTDDSRTYRLPQCQPPPLTGAIRPS